LKPHPSIPQEQKQNTSSENKPKTIPESEEPLLQDNTSFQYSPQQQVTQIQNITNNSVNNQHYNSQQNSTSRKMDQNKQPQIHPTPVQPQMSQMSPMTQPNPYQNQVLLQNPSQAQLYNTQGQYSITVNTNVSSI